jgi:CRP-like cAMP-binding protein
MSEQDRRNMVAASPVAANLSEDDCAELAKLVLVRELKNGDPLIHEGQVDNSLHVIVEGMLAVTKPTGGGDWVTLHILKTGDLAGELGFVDGMEHTATLRAVGDARVFSLERESLESLLDVRPRLVYEVMRNVVREVHGILRRMNIQYVELTNYITKQHGRY